MTDSEVERARQEFAHLSYVLFVRKRLLVLTLNSVSRGRRKGSYARECPMALL
jgi:hypothetical protein